ncbi:uncharacterized protein LOC144342249, partial [Saccoglossus kowalevskii]
VLSSRVANALAAFHANGNQATIKFVRNFDKFFDCLNVRSMKEGINKRKPNLLPFNNPADPRLEWLKKDFLQYLADWDEAVDQRVEISKSDRVRMKLSRETLEGIRMT